MHVYPITTRLRFHLETLLTDDCALWTLTVHNILNLSFLTNANCNKSKRLLNIKIVIKIFSRENGIDSFRHYHIGQINQ